MKTTINVAVAAGVGMSGEKIHRMPVSVRFDAMSGTVGTYFGSVYCGSRRQGSGTFVQSLDPSTVNCLRCGTGPEHETTREFGNTRWIGIADASRVIETHGRGSRITATPWAIETVTPVLSDERAARAAQLRATYASEMAEYKRVGYQNPEAKSHWQAAMDASREIEIVVHGDEKGA